MKKLFLILFLAASYFTSLADDYPRDWNVDVTHYRFQILLNDANDQIVGKALVVIYFKENTSSVVLDLVNSTEGKGMYISLLKVKGMESAYTHENNKVKITPNTSFAKGSTAEIEIEYAGIPIDGLVISSNKFGERTFFGDNYPTRGRNWLPCVDHPSDKATVEWVVIAPEKYSVIGSGLRTEESLLDNGNKLTRWKQSVPISTKIMVIGVSRFSVEQSGMVNNIPIESWVYPQNREDGFYDYSPAVEIVRFYDSFIGEYPYEKLANVQSKTRYGGMENASNIFYSERSVSGKRSINNLLAHEIAHQWFGNSVTEKSWHHAWLSEGITSYYTHLYVEYTKGVEAKRDGMKKDRDNIIRYYKKSPNPIVYTEVTDYIKMLNTNTYQKGSWVMNMLRRKIGDDDFYKGMRMYYSRYRDDNALTEDLKNVMEEVSGEELDLFFNQWVFEAGHPALEMDWEYNKSKKTVQIRIVQNQEVPFQFDIDFKIGDQINTVSVDKREASFSFDSDSKPSEITVDPETWLLYEGTLTAK